jgi:hypothetical protein
MPPDTPDFDSMSPEEIMKWMESLAVRQGATEGFTTAADMQVAEIDPTSVVIDEPGYVPSEGASKRTTPAQPAKPAEAPKPVAPPPPPPAPEPVLVQPPAPEPLTFLDQLTSQTPEEAETELAPAIDSGALSWLESLAADTGGSPLPTLDFPGLTDAPAAQDAADPLSWLSGLSQGQTEPPAAPPTPQPTPAPAADISDPLSSGVDPLTWLESLAVRQGAKQEELLTSADVSVPVPDNPVIQGPGYEPFSFDKAPAKPQERPTPPSSFTPPAATPEPEPLQLEDPNAWLNSLAETEGFTGEMVAPPASAGSGMSDDDIRVALETGRNVPPTEMEAFLSRQMDKLFEEPEAPVEAYDPDAPAVRAEIPDWLLEQAGTPPAAETSAPPAPVESAMPLPIFTEEVTPPVAADLPDWLKPEPGESLEIFEIEDVQGSAPVPASVSAAPAEIDESDPWVVAFEESEEDLQKWYEQTVSETKTAGMASPVPSQTQSGELEEVYLSPETDLTEGTPEGMPDWLQEAAPQAADIPDWLREEVVVETPAFPTSEGLPDWLAEAQVTTNDVPDWLLDTLEEDAAAVVPTAPAQTTATELLPVVPPPVQIYSPAPPAADVGQINIAELLNSARTRIGSSDVDGGLRDYEQVIRANAQLDAVTSDLRKLAERYSNNPAVYRVLGDALMRQGKLQEALNTYRKALNQL